MVEISLKVLNFSFNLNSFLKHFLIGLFGRTLRVFVNCGFFKIDLDAFVNYGGH